jgi:hypothetical protein
MSSKEDRDLVAGHGMPAMPEITPTSSAEDRYRAAVHGMQTAVQMTVLRGVSDEAKPARLRGDLNIAAIDHSALARLLIAKGIIGEPEYLEALAAGMEAEVTTYENQLGVSLA